jgi:menaquinone-dependent protoporphyrinogen IX oxidase
MYGKNGNKHFNFGKKNSEETRKKISKSLKNKITKCPYCGLIGGGTNMKRYHFDKCKLKYKSNRKNM